MTMKKRRKKFKSITLKLSANQMQSLLNYCEARKTTPNKLIKKNISNYTKGYNKAIPEKYLIQHNQLDLFEKDQEPLDLFN